MLSGLYGLSHTNRDFSKTESWGKNQFNNSFPVALLCYMTDRSLPLNVLYYDSLTDGVQIRQEHLSAIIGIDHADAFFSFESIYRPYSRYNPTKLYNSDVVVSRRGNVGDHVFSAEIKLCVVPDCTTEHLADDLMGPEIVFRTSGVLSLASTLLAQQECAGIDAVSMLGGLTRQNAGLLKPDVRAIDWSAVLCVVDALLASDADQRAVIIQPIWRVDPALDDLAEHCLDCFVWTDKALLYLIRSLCMKGLQGDKVTRAQRTLIWLVAMWMNYAEDGQFRFESVVGGLVYGTRNDKALSVSGTVTNRFLASPCLTTPRVRREEIGHVIRGGGHRFLRPEKRFDAYVKHAAHLFGGAGMACGEMVSCA